MTANNSWLLWTVLATAAYTTWAMISFYISDLEVSAIESNLAYLCAVLPILVVYVCQNRESIRLPYELGWSRFLWSAALGFVSLIGGQFYNFALGVDDSPKAAISAISGAYPSFVYIIQVLIGKDTTSLLKVLGTCFILVGIVCNAVT